MSLYVWLVGALVWVGTLAGAFLYGIDTGDDRATAAVAREERVARVATAAAVSAAASAIAGIEVKQVTIRQKAQTEIRREPIYMDCQHPDAVRRLLDAALTNSEPASAAGSGKLPEAIRTDR